MNNCYETNG